MVGSGLALQAGVSFGGLGGRAEPTWTGGRFCRVGGRGLGLSRPSVGELVHVVDGEGAAPRGVALDVAHLGTDTAVRNHIQKLPERPGTFLPLPHNT